MNLSLRMNHSSCRASLVPKGRPYNPDSTAAQGLRQQENGERGDFVTRYTFGSFELRPDERALLSASGPLDVGARAFDLLLALIERRDRVVSMDELMQAVWPGRVVEENNLSVQIHFLRRLLGHSTIATVRGRGFRFVSAVRVLTDRELRPSPLLACAAPTIRHDLPPVLLALAVDGVAAETLLRLDRAELPAGVRAASAHRTEQHARCYCCDNARTAVQWLWALRTATDGGAVAASAIRAGMVEIDAGALAGAEELSVAGGDALGLARQGEPGSVLCDSAVTEQLIDGVDADIVDLGLIDPGLSPGLRAFRLEWPASSGNGSAVANRRDTLTPTIAVLPFETLLGEDVNDLFGEALADDVITLLSGHAELQVVSGLSSRRLRRCGWPVDSVANTLLADFVLHGSYRVRSGRLEVNVQLQPAGKGSVLWSARYECPVREAFAPETALAPAMVESTCRALYLHALGSVRSRPLVQTESYSLLFAAVGLMHRLNRQEFELARELLLFLATRPGAHGVASAWLANWHVMRVVQGWSADPQSDSRTALDFVARSLDADSRHALALSIGGLVHAYLRKDMKTAGEYYDTALAANPSEALAWLFRSVRSAWVGDGADAESSALRALRLSPIDPLRYFFDSLAATAALGNANWALAEELGWRSVRANRTHASTWRTLAYAQVMLGKEAAARESVGELLRIEPGYTVSRLRERFPGRDGPMAQPLADALTTAGLPA